MRDMYLHPTIRRLALVLDPMRTGASRLDPEPATQRHEVVRASTARYLFTGAAQLVTLVASPTSGSLLLARGFIWSTSATTR